MTIQEAEGYLRNYIASSVNDPEKVNKAYWCLNQLVHAATEYKKVAYQVNEILRRINRDVPLPEPEKKNVNDSDIPF